MTAAASEPQRSKDLTILTGLNARPSLCAIEDQLQLLLTRAKRARWSLYSLENIFHIMLTHRNDYRLSLAVTAITFKRAQISQYLLRWKF
jgi:hypothetical protein